jgi:Tol biopolymer transport system component
MAYRLGIDLGTTYTVASVAADGAPIQLLDLSNRSQQMRSMLWLAEDGQFVIGDAAVDRAASDPGRMIMDPRRQLGTDVPLIIGGQEITSEQATAAVLDFVLSRATAQHHEKPSEIVISYPAHWDEYTIECFDRAIAAANLDNARRCTDAEAAVATYVARESLGAGQRVVVYDLGGGSCEVTVLEKTPAGTRVLGASQGSDHPSGADFDEAVLRLVINNLGDRGHDLDKDDPDSKLRLARIRQACMEAKEALSTAPEAQVPVSLPGYTSTIRLGHQEFVSLIRPALRDSVAMTTRVLSAGGVQPSDLAAILLVGGSAHIPLVAEMLQREFDRVPIALGTHPEYDVAIGTLLVPGAGNVTATGPVTLSAIAAPAGAEAAQAIKESRPAEEQALPAEEQAPPVEQTPPAEEPSTRAPEESPQEQEDGRVIAETPKFWAPAIASEDDRPTDQLPPAAAASPAAAAAQMPVPGPQAPGPNPEETMPDHLIFDYFTQADADVDETIPGQTAYAAEAYPSASEGAAPPGTASSPPLPPWAQASAAVPTVSAAGSSPQHQTAAQYGGPAASSSYPSGQRPPGSPPGGPGSFPSPGQYPPGQYPPGQSPGPGGPWSPAPPPGYTPGSPPTQPYGVRGPGGPGGYPPGPGGEEPGGSRARLILIIAGVVILIGAAVVAGVYFLRSGQPSGNASPSVYFPTPVSPTTASPTPSATSSGTQSASPSNSPSASATSSPTSGPAQKLPASAPIPLSEVIVPMRFDNGPDRPLYIVDTEGKIKQLELPTPDGGNANPIMQTSRNTIIYLNSGVLRVMAADGSGDRKLFNRDPAGCRRVDHAAWSVSDPNVVLISCRVSKNKVTLLLVGMDGRLIRRLDTGKGIVGDATLSPDGQTVLYWTSIAPNEDGGSLFTLPIIGTGAPKRLTNSADGVDADPAWSPDGNQIAFRRNVPNGTLAGNEDVFVMNADGSGERAVASTPAADFKPIWSPDSNNLLIISNRKSDNGGPGGTFDLWLTRVRDGEVLDNLGLKARQITRPFWTLR